MGIYVASGGNYCLPGSDGGYYCPEAMVNSGGKVYLRLREWPDFQNVSEVHLQALDGVDLVRIHADQRRMDAGVGVDVEVKNGSTVEKRTLKGKELKDLKLTLAIGGDTYQVSLKPREPQTGDNIARYVLSYRKRDGSEVTMCNDKMGVSFLPGKVVDGVNAETKDDGNAVTVACGSGAIITCLALGYTPWNDRGEWEADRDFVYRSCLQAQRAAYFVGIENTNSFDNVRTYRKSDLPISMWDPTQASVDTGDLEAIWTPRGAVCLNSKFMDESKFLDKNQFDANSKKLNPCEPPVDWKQGKLATRLAKKP